MSQTSRPDRAQFAAALPAFDIVDTAYKTVKGIPIPVSLLITKTIRPGRCPVIVRWHGGCFITGHRLFPRWFGRWTLEAALSRMAIIISPDYRLLPEASGQDMLQDLRDFYEWLREPDAVAAHLPDGVLPDIEHLLIIGESAGGWLAVQSGLLLGAQSCISGIIARYPMLDLRDGHYKGDYKQDPFESPNVEWDRTALANHRKNLKGDEVVTSGIPPDRMPLVVDMMRGGHLSRLFGDEPSLYPLEAVQSVQHYPPLWVIHGVDDRLVPFEGSQRFVEQLRKVLPRVQIHESYREGSHGFDNNPGVSVKEGWIQEGLAFMTPFWPKC